MIAEIKDACSEKDYEYLSIYGHTLMGASENASAVSTKDIGFDIQIAGKARRIKAVKPHSSLGYRPPAPETIQPRWLNLQTLSHKHCYN